MSLIGTLGGIYIQRQRTAPPRRHRDGLIGAALGPGHVSTGMPKQFRCVSVDLLARQSVVHRSGLLTDVISCSMRLPRRRHPRQRACDRARRAGRPGDCGERGRRQSGQRTALMSVILTSQLNNGENASGASKAEILREHRPGVPLDQPVLHELSRAYSVVFVVAVVLAVLAFIPLAFLPKWSALTALSQTSSLERTPEPDAAPHGRQSPPEDTRPGAGRNSSSNDLTPSGPDG